MNKYAAKIDKMRSDRGWTVYRLSQETGVPDQTINKWFYKNAMITIPSLLKVCETFSITLAEFFSDNKVVELSPKVVKLYDMWCVLTSDEKASVETIIKNYVNNKKA